MDPQSFYILSTLTLIFFAAIGGGIIAKKLKLPTLAGYIAAGFILRNLFPMLLENKILSMIADTGVTLLLFALGLEFSLVKLRKIFGTITLVVITQIIIVTLLLYFICISLGITSLVAFILSLAGSLSSTAIVIRLLSEKGELDTVPGELASAWLVIQDLSVIPIMLILPIVVQLGMGRAVSTDLLIGSIAVGILKSGIALILILILGRDLIPKVLNKLVKVADHEIYGLTVLAIVLFTAVLTYALGLSAALGAFLAGVVIADTSQNHAIFAEIRPLRNMFAVVFFISLGLSIPVNTVITNLPALIILTVSVVIIKFFIVALLARFLEYHRKTAFLTGLYLIPISEFAFIIGQMALSQGALSQNQAILLNSWVFLSILTSALLFSNPHQLYYSFAKTFGKYIPKFFPSDISLTNIPEQLTLKDHIVICGYGRVGKYIGRALEMADIPYVVVDYNHEVVEQLRKRGVVTIYGDPADKDVLDYAQVDYAKAVVIAIPDRHTQEMIITNSQSLNRRIKIICRTHHEEDLKHLKSLGVQMVVQPEFAAAVNVSEKLLTEFGLSQEDISGKISRLKIEHGLG